MVFGFFKRKKKEEANQDEILAVVEELVVADDETNETEELERESLESNDKIKTEESTIDNSVENIDDINLEDSSNKFEPEPKSEQAKTSFFGLFKSTKVELNPEEIVAENTDLSDEQDAKQDNQLLEVTNEENPELIAEINENVDDSHQEVNEPQKQSSWLKRLAKGLGKTRDSFNKKLLGIFGGGQIDEDLYEELESVLLTSDVGISATTEILERVRKKVSLKGLKDSSELKLALKEALVEVVADLEKPLDVAPHQPFVIMMVGINGAGKTTSIGKLAKYFQSQGKSVMLAAGDTFRAAAREQLIEWGNRNNVTVVTQQTGDSAAVCYDAIQSAIAKKVDVVLADTAGRLPTQLHLMEEIKKVKRVISKALPDAPHEIMLVLDATIGQNAINQVVAFDDALGLTGLVLTKLDGTAKGGVVCAIAKERPIPLRFIGVGETIDDLRPFIATEYVNALIGDEEIK